MKKIKLLQILALGIGLMLFTLNVWGQIVAWDSNGLTGGGTAPWSATTVASNIQGTPQITVGSGCSAVGGTPPANAFVRTAMTATNQAGAISGNDYFEFSISPSTGYKISYSTIDANFRRTSTGANNFIFQYSLDGFATSGIDIGTSATYLNNTNGVAISQISLSGITALQNVTGTVSFRLYWWGETGSTQSAGIGRLSGNDLSFGGSVTLIGGNPVAATPTFDPPAGSYFTAQNVTISTTTPDSTIYYTTDGTDPDEYSTEYTGPVSVSATTTLKAIAYAPGYDPSAIATAVYTFPTEVANIATLRAQATGSTQYKLTGEAILTFQTSSRNAKYLQDATGAILIDDNSGIITTSYNLYDGITGIIGTLGTYQNMLQFTPVTDPGAATSSGNTITPEVITIAQLATANQAKLVKILNASISATGNFAASTNYTITDASKATGVLRTAYTDLDYIGQPIPVVEQDIIGVVLQYQTTMQLVPRSTGDFSNSPVPYPVTFFVDMSNAPAFTTVEVAGDFNGWSGNTMSLVSDNIYSYTTGSVFYENNVVTFKFRINGGATWEPDPNRTYTVVAGTNEYHAVWGVMVPAVIGWVNLQYPESGTISVGGDFNVYGRVYANGLTGTQGTAPNLKAWVGYSTENTNPNTWANWITASFNSDYGNDEEYMANLGTTITEPGVYYYATRFKLGLAGYVYGGYSPDTKGGGFWDGTTYVSGELTINAAQPTNHVTGFTATTNSSSAITVTWTDSDADYYLIKGSDVGYGSITDPVDGTAESDGPLVKNVASDVQEYQFTSLQASTTYYFKIYPYNGTGTAVNYKTDGSVPEDDATTNEQPVIIINEVDADTPGTDAAEFVELYDGGIGNTPLDDLVVVFFNGSNDLSYAAFDLDGKSTNANGYFVLGNAGVTGVELVFAGNILQNGQDAVALYFGDATSFPNGTAVTTNNLLDAFVYDTDDADDPGLLVLLNSGQPQINENGRENGTAHSSQRLPNGTGGQRNTSTYDQTFPTPNAQNGYPTFTWTGATDTDWNTATNWSSGIVPDITANVIIPNVAILPNAPVINNFAANAKNIEIQPDGVLTVEASGGPGVLNVAEDVVMMPDSFFDIFPEGSVNIGGDFTMGVDSFFDIFMEGFCTVGGTLTNNAGAGNLTIHSDATGTGSLIHSTADVPATVERYITGHNNVNDAGWHLLGSPVAAFTIAGSSFEPGSSDDLYAWDEVQNLWLNYKAGNPTQIAPGTGYLVSYQNTGTKVFTGTLSVSNINKSNLSLTGGTNSGWHLLGNPFASALRWNDGNWALNNLAGTAKIWNAAGKSYSDIAASGIIPSSQGFMVQVSVNNDNSITIPAASRLHDAAAWYKSSGNDKIRLVAATQDGSYFQESNILLNPESTIGFDFAYDSRFLPGYAPQFYAVCNDEKLSTNSLPALSGSGAIPFGFVKNQASDYLITLTENIEGMQLILEDVKLNQTQVLNDYPVYQFISETGDDPNRFLLHFGTVGIQEHLVSVLHAYMQDNILYVVNPGTGKALLAVYNAQGQMVSQEEVGAGLQSMNLKTAPGVYIVRLITGTSVLSQKIVIQ